MSPLNWRGNKVAMGREIVAVIFENNLPQVAFISFVSSNVYFIRFLFFRLIQMMD